MLKGRTKHHASSKITVLGLLVLGLISISFYLTSILYAEENGKAAKFPAKPVRIIIPVAAGGSLGREIMSIAPFIEKYLGVKTVIDYIPGADGIIAYNKFNKEKPNGYTLSYFSTSSAIPLELSRENAKFSVKNFAPVAAWNIKNYVLLVHPDNWKTFSEFLSETEKRNVSITGTGSGATETQYRLMEKALGKKLNYVPYKASGEADAAVAGKHIDAVLTFTISALPMARAGKLKALVVYSSKRDPFLPEVPTLKESGHEEIPILPTYGMFAAPPNTPKEVIAVLEKAIRNATADLEFNSLSKKVGNTLDFKSSAELKKLILETYESLSKHNLFAS